MLRGHAAATPLRIYFAWFASAEKSCCRPARQGYGERMIHQSLCPDSVTRLRRGFSAICLAAAVVAALVLLALGLAGFGNPMNAGAAALMALCFALGTFLR
jgi:high-affinity Fe2+/Pb2+ permease